MKKNPDVIISSRHLKIIAAKKDLLKDAVVLVCLDENKYSKSDSADLTTLTEQIEKIEPSGIYFPVVREMNMQIYDRAEFKHRDLIITVRHVANVDHEELEDRIKSALPEAKSITFVHEDIDIT